jgi:hypothetical protein
MEPEGSLPHLQLPATCLYPEPAQSSPEPHLTSWRAILILSSHLRLGLPSGLFTSRFPSKTLYTPLSSPIRATCLAYLILLDFITRTILGKHTITLGNIRSFLLFDKYLSITSKYDNAASNDPFCSPLKSHKLEADCFPIACEVTYSCIRIAALIEIGERKCFGQGTKFAEFCNTPHEYVSIMSMIISRFEKLVYRMQAWCGSLLIWKHFQELVLWVKII